MKLLTKMDKFIISSLKQASLIPKGSIRASVVPNRNLSVSRAVVLCSSLMHLPTDRHSSVSNIQVSFGALALARLFVVYNHSLYE